MKGNNSQHPCPFNIKMIRMDSFYDVCHLPQLAHILGQHVEVLVALIGIMTGEVDELIQRVKHRGILGPRR